MGGLFYALWCIGIPAPSPPVQFSSVVHTDADRPTCEQPRLYPARAMVLG
jgi:hypothetical protein